MLPYTCSAATKGDFPSYSGTPLIRSPMGPKKLPILTGGRINEGFFYKKMYGGFCQAGKKKWP